MLDSLEALGITEPTPLEEFEFYDGTETIYFDREHHVYSRLERETHSIVPGATTVTNLLDKPQLKAWAAKMTVEYIRDNIDLSKLYSKEEMEDLLDKAKKSFAVYTEAAATTGAIAHDWIERYIRRRLYNMAPTDFIERMPEDERAANGIKAALKWFSEHHVVFIFCERKVYSREYDVAGTLDVLAIVDGKLAILDFKTSNHMHRFEYGMQTAIYQHAVMEELGGWLKETFGLEITERWILRLSKEDAEFVDPLHLTQEDYKQDLVCFLSVLDTWRNMELHEHLERIRKAEKRADKKAQKDKAALEEKLEKARVKEAKKAEKTRLDEEKKALRAQGQSLKRTRKRAA